MQRILKHMLGPLVGLAALTAAGTAWAQETQTSDTAADTTVQDSSEWGRDTNREPEAENPPGYRGMERPVGSDSLADTTDTTGSSADTTGAAKSPDDTIRAGETEPKTPESPDPRMPADPSGHAGHGAAADTSGP